MASKWKSIQHDRVNLKSYIRLHRILYCTLHVTCFFVVVLRLISIDPNEESNEEGKEP